MRLDDADLAHAIAALPDDVNPYEWIMRRLFHAVVPEVGAWFEAVLDFAFVLQGLGLILSLALLVVKILAGSFWLFKRRPVVDGMIVTSNSVVLFALLHLIHYSFFLPCTYYVRESFFHQGNPLYYQALVSFTFTPLALLGWLEAHGSTVSVILAWPSLSSGTPIKKLEHLLVEHSKAVARAINAFVVSGVTATIVLNYVFFGMATVYFKKLCNTFRDIQELVAESSASWTPGQTATFPDEVISLTHDFKQAGVSASKWIGAGFGVYTVSFLLALVLYVPSVSLYLRMLGRQLWLSRAQAHQSTNTANAPGAVPGEKEHARRVARTYTLILIESLMVLILTCMFTAICMWLAIMPGPVMGNAKAVSAMWTSVCVAYQTVSVPLLGILVTRSVLSNDFKSRIGGFKPGTLNLAFASRQTASKSAADTVHTLSTAAASERDLYRKL